MKIEKIINMNLVSLSMKDNSVIEDDNVEYSIVVNTGTGDLLKLNDSENIYSLKVRFRLVVIPADQSEELRENNKWDAYNKESVLTSFVANYNLIFAASDVDPKDTAQIKILNSKILAYFEPYLRELMDNVYSRTDIGVPSLPISFLSEVEMDETN